MGRFDTVALRCPSWRAQVTQLASFMALPRSAAEEQVSMHGVVISISCSPTFLLGLLLAWWPMCWRPHERL